MTLDYDNNRDGTVTVYPPCAADPMLRRPGIGVLLDESELRTLLKAVENQ